MPARCNIVGAFALFLFLKDFSSFLTTELLDFFFYVLLTVHLSIFILVINQLDAQNLFYGKFVSCLYMFRAQCAHRQDVKILLYSLIRAAIYRCDDTRGCIIKF